MAKSKGEHYVDNKVFLQAMIEWKEACNLSKEDDDGRKPAVTNYIGECFLNSFSDAQCVSCINIMSALFSMHSV